MWNIKEEDLDEFRMTCNNRLSPEGLWFSLLEDSLYFSIYVFILWGLGVL